MSKSKKVFAGGNPAFDERAPEMLKERKQRFFAGGNPGFDERKIVQAVEKIATIRKEQKK